MSLNTGNSPLSHSPCPFEGCNSRDAYSIFKGNDGREYGKCFSCGKSTSNPYKCYSSSTISFLNSCSKQESNKLDNLTPSSLDVPEKHGDQTGLEEDQPSSVKFLHLHSIKPLADREISEETAKRFGVRTGVSEEDGTSPTYRLFPITKDGGKTTGYLYKSIKEKECRFSGDCKGREPFGYSLLPSKGKKIFITEGAEDAMALYEILKNKSTIDWEPPVIALLGANGAVNSLLSIKPHLENFEEIVLCLDQDKAGEEATKKICKIFPNKSYIASFSEKDPNNMKMKGKEDELKWAVLSKARKYKPDKIVDPSECWDRFKKVNSQKPYPYPPFLDGLNKKVYGVNPGSIIIITGPTGSGKSQLMGELKYWFYNSTDEKIADISLEEDVGDSISRLISIHLNKRIGLPDVESTEEEQRKAFEYLFSTDRFAMYDHFGGMDDTSLFDELAYLAGNNYNFIFLDHLSIIVSEYASQGGERERIDTIMTKLAKFVKSTGAIVFLVVHLRKNDNSYKSKSFENGAIPDLDDLRGSSCLKQLAWEIWGISRDQQSVTHPNDMHIHNLKSRSTGNTGYCGVITFDKNTGRMRKKSDL